ncbi:MAG: SpoIID/LytB domain-containing protein [Actinobacteria bacterium]|nr:SpoIID/LytB domain-containing protein [Actinomycetota bacterium]
MRRLCRAVRRAILVISFLAALLVHTTPASAASVGFRFDGGGWGHGLGMGQWGAKGQADTGRSVSQILQSYYQGTTVGTPAGRGSIRVGVLQNVSTVTIRSAGAAPGSSSNGRFAFGWGNGSGHLDGYANETWEIRAVSATSFQLFKNGTAASPSFGGVLHVDYDWYGSIISVSETGHQYRHGFFDVVHRSGASAFDVVAQLASYTDYLYGLGEMPSSWHVNALRAQAIAGYTYALEKAQRLGDFRSGCACTVFASTLDQAYIGWDKEAEATYGPRWVDAVNSVAGQAVLYNGAPIQALYSSSTGGHTEDNEFVFGSSPLPYLRGVPDPSDATPGNPNHTWAADFSANDLSARLNANSATAVGTVTDVQIVSPLGVSGRVGRVVDDTHGGVRLIGSSGTKRVSGSTLQSVLGLKSTLFRVSKDVQHPNGAILKGPGPTVWVLRDGARWPAWNESAFFTRGSYSEMLSVTDATLMQYPQAGAGFRDGVLLLTPDGKVWIVSNRQRRHITSDAVMSGLGLSYSNVRHVDESTAAVHPQGSPVSSSSSLVDGMFVKLAASPRVYLIRGGVAHYVAHDGIFKTYRASYAEVATVSSTQLGVPGDGAGFRDGTLIRTGDGQVWAISDSQRRHIANQSVYDSLGYRSGAWIQVSDADAALHPVGPAINGGPHPNGALVKANNGPTVWVVVDGTRYPFSDEQAFFTRASYAELAVVSPQVLNPLPVLSLGWRPGSLIRTPDGRVWIISADHDARRHIQNDTVFSGMGLSYSNVRNVSFLDAAVHPEGAPLSAAAAVDGMFMRRSNDARIFLISGGRARPVVSATAFASYRASDGEIVNNGPFPAEGVVVGFRDGTLIMTNAGRVYAIADGAKRWIQGDAVFHSLGYDYADVIRVTDAEAAAHPDGAVIG